VNYGFVPGTRSADGEELDAYVLGVAGPLRKFEGDCIAVVRRKQDADDKLVIVPAGLRLSEEAIRRAIDFQEQFFESDIIVAS
jgi:inorganic pyrophosphatase